VQRHIAMQHFAPNCRWKAAPCDKSVLHFCAQGIITRFPFAAAWPMAG